MLWRMVSWNEVEKSEPEFAAKVRRLFDAHKHKTIATLRADGSPRISGIEATFGDGRLLLGMMPGSRKAKDLLRDPRIAVHSGSPEPSDEDPSDWAGDAKVAGRAIAVQDRDALRAIGVPEGDDAPHVFEVDVTELVVIRVGDPPDHLLIEAWHEGRGVSTSRRA